MERKTTRLRLLLLIPAFLLGLSLFAQKAVLVSPAGPVPTGTIQQESVVPNHRPSTWQSEEEIMQMFNLSPENIMQEHNPVIQAASNMPASPEQLAVLQQKKLEQLEAFQNPQTQNVLPGPHPTDIPSSPTDVVWSILFNFQAVSSLWNFDAVESDGTFIYCASWNYPGLIYKYTTTGTLMGSFTLTNWPAAVSGIYSMTSDGTFFYAVGYTGIIMKINMTTQTVVSTITTSLGGLTFIGYDPTANSGAGGFWTGSVNNISLVSMTGATLLTVPGTSITPFISGISGCVYDPYTAAGSPNYLWFSAQDGTNYATLHQFNRQTQSFTGVTHDMVDIPGVIPGSLSPHSYAGSIAASSSLVPGKFVLIAIVQSSTTNTSNSPVAGYELANTFTFAGDVGISALPAPASSMTLTNNEPVTVTIHNYGTIPQTNIPVSYTFQAGTGCNSTPVTVVETYSGPLIPANGNQAYTFTAHVDMHVYGNYTITACTMMSLDQNTGNDCKTFSVVHNIPTVTDTLYPMNAPYWTGTCTPTAFTDNSYIHFNAAVSAGWAKFNLSTLSGAAIVNSITIRAYFGAPWDYPYMYFTPLLIDPMTSTPAAVYSAIGGYGATNYYYDELFSSVSPESYQQFTFNNGNYINDFVNQIPLGWFAVGFWDWDYSTFYGTAQGWAQTNRPQLIVNHSNPIPHDVGVTSVDLDPYALANQPYQPKATIHNYGTVVETNIPIHITGPNGYDQMTTLASLAVGATTQVTFPAGNFTAGGNKCFTVCTQLTTDMVNLNDTKSNCMQFDAYLTQAYGYVAAGTGLVVGPCKFFLQHPQSITSLAPTSTQLISGGAWAHNVWYVNEIVNASNTHGHLYRVNTTTGVMTDIGPLGGMTIQALAFDHTTNTMYGIGTVAGSVAGTYIARIYTINTNTGAATLANYFGTQLGAIISLACNNAGMLFATDIAANQIWAIDPATWALDRVGPTGLTMTGVQGASFDKVHDIYYHAGYLTSAAGNLYSYSLVNGVMNMIGNFQGNCEMTGFVIPFSYESTPNTDIGAMWLVQPQSGNLSNSEPVGVKLRNYGLTSASGFNICYKFPGQAIYCEAWDIFGSGGPLLPGDTWYHFFANNVDCHNPGGYPMYAYVTAIPGDNNQVNDTTWKMVRNVACGQIACFPASIQEVETCGDDINGGCNVVPNAFVDILNGQTYCGTTWKIDTLRDTDWYRFTINSTKVVSVMAKCEMNCDFVIVPLPCSLNTISASKTFNKCTLDSLITGNLTAGSYALIVAHNFSDYNTYCQGNPKYTFTLNLRPGKPCDANHTYVGSPGGDEYISNVTITPGSINNSTISETGCYADYTSMVTDMTTGSSYTLFFSNGCSSTWWPSDYNGAWVDWNQNLSFYDAGEKLTVNPSPGGPTISATIIPPATALPGPTRLRCRIEYATSNIDPCLLYSFGETEDYTIYVHPPIPPVQVTFPTISQTCPGTYCIPITVTNAQNINGLTLTLSLGTGITYVGFQNVNSQLGTGMSVNPTGNVVVINWFNGTQAANITNGATLLELCVSTTPGTHNITWLTGSNGCVFTSVQYGTLISNYTNGTLTYGNCSDLNGRVRYKHYTNFNAGIIVPYFFKDSVTVQLKQGTTVMYSVNVADSGKYAFTNLPNGAYTLTATTNKLWNGGNATDALTILRNFVGIPPLLSGLNLICADVNGSGGIPNAADALAVSRRFVGAITNFLPPNVPSPGGPDWYFDKIPVTITGTANQTIHFFGLCAGDVNGSNIPLNTSISPIKQTPTVYLTSEGSLQIDKSVMNVPVYTEKEMSVGAISLVLNYPKNLEIMGVSVAGNSDNLVWEAHNGSLKIAWWNLDPLVLKANDVMLTLKVKATSLNSSDMQFTTTEESQISNEEAVTIDNAMLYMPKLTSGINPGDYTLTNFPNPFNHTTEIRYSIPQDGHVVIKVYNVLGEEVAVVVNLDQTAGTHVVTFNGTDLKRGVYVYKLEVNNVTKINSMIVSE